MPDIDLFYCHLKHTGVKTSMTCCRPEAATDHHDKLYGMKLLSKMPAHWLQVERYRASMNSSAFI